MRTHDAPFAARLIALAVLVRTLFGLASTLVQRLTHIALRDPDRARVSYEEQLATLSALGNASLLLELLLVGLLVAGAVRYGRDLGDRPVSNLALGAGALFAVDAAAHLGFKLWVWLALSPPTDALPTIDVLFWLGLLATVCGGLGLVVLLIACARSERLVGDARALWARATIGAFALYALADVLLGSQTLRVDLERFSPVDLLPPLYAATMLACAVGLVVHARRIEDDAARPAWARAAAGLDRYRDATALRVLTAVCLGVFLMLARISGYSPTVMFGGIALISLAGLIVGLVQIAGLVRVADAPGPRRALGLAVPLLGLGVAAECVSLAPIAAYACSGGEQRMLLRAIDLASVGGAAQGLGLLAMVVLLLALRDLARERAAPQVVARCNVMLAALGIVVAGAMTLVYVARDLGRDATAMLLLGAGVTLTITAVWLIVVYFRLLAALRDAMLRAEPA